MASCMQDGAQFVPRVFVAPLGADVFNVYLELLFEDVYLVIDA